MPGQLRMLVPDDHRADDFKAKKSNALSFVSSLWHFPEPGEGQLYRWYGTLPAPLVDRLLSLYAAELNSRVLDPFAGTGVTLGVSQQRGLGCDGLDVNPLACLISEARIQGRPDLSAGDVRGLFEGLEAGIHDYGQEANADFLGEPSYAYTRKWFGTESLERALAVFSAIAGVTDKRLQRLLFVAAAQEVRNVASVDARCTHHLVTKKKPFIDLWPGTRTRFLENLDQLRPAREGGRSTIKQGSALNNVGGEYDFVLAHPPYLGVIHYHLIHRLATDLLDFARRRFSASALLPFDFSYSDIKEGDVSTDNETRYRLFIDAFALAMEKAVKPGGAVALIIGDQRHKGRLRHPFTDFIRAFEDRSFVLEENFIWALHNNGGMHVLRRGHFIDHNYILVFRKAA